MSYCASKSVQPFGFCRYISSWKSRYLKLCLKKHGENFKIFFHFEVPWLRTPWTECIQKVLGTTTFTPEHVCEISLRLLHIFEKLWHEERIALDREEAKKKENKFDSLLLVKVKLNNWWPRSGLPGSLKVKLIALSDSRSIGYYKCTSVTIALSRTESLFFPADDLDLNCQGHQRSNWSCHSNRDLWVPISVA